jgi:signal transduction histidine kinase
MSTLAIKRPTGHHERSESQPASDLTAAPFDVAQILHDEVIPSITAVTLALNSGPLDAVSRRRCMKALQSALDTTRDLVERGASDRLGATFHQSNLPAVDIVVSGRHVTIPGPAIDLILATLREALGNATKHADAKRVRAEVSVRSDRVSLDFSNRRAPQSSRDRAGSGLRLLAARAEAIGGAVRTSDSLEWRTRVEVPVR